MTAINPIRFYNTGENPHSKAVLDRPIKDLLTGSGWLADGTDFGGFVTYPIANGETAGNITNYRYPVRNVKRYGALGDDTQDDTVYIQRAVTACNAAGGGTIIFPDGTYKTSAAINLGTTGNITLKAEGGKTTLHPTTASQRAITCGGAISDVVIDGINIVGTSFALGIVLVPVTRARIQNLTVSGANANDPTLPSITAGIYCGTATDVTIDNCQFSNNGYVSATPQTLGGDIFMGANGGVGDVQQNITITRCKCRSTSVIYNIAVFDASNSLIQGNECSGAIVDAASNVRGGYGILLYTTTSNPGAVHHNRVIGNTIKNTQGTGIYFQSSHYSVAAENILQGTASAQNDVSLASGAIALASCYGSSAVGNIINNVYLTAITVSDNDGTHGGCVVANNVIDNVIPQVSGGLVRPCVYLRGVLNRIGVHDNEITNTSTLAGIGMYDNGGAMPVSTGLRITGNSITGARVAGNGTVACTAGAATFSASQAGVIANGDKILVGLIAYTVSAFSGTTTCTLSGAPTFTATGFSLPKVTASNSYGILLTGAQDSIIDGNSIDNVAASGIRAADGSAGGNTTKRIKVTNNTVVDGNSAGFNSYGIQVYGTDCLIQGNHATAGTLGQQYGGIVAQGAGTLVTGNNTRANTTSDIAVSAGAVEWGNFTSTNVSTFISTAPVINKSRTAMAQSTPTEASLIAGLDVTGSNSAVITLTAARLVAATGSANIGQRFVFTFIQDGTGGRNVTWNAVFKVSWSDAGNTAGKRSSIAFIWDGTNWNQDGAQTPYV